MYVHKTEQPLAIGSAFEVSDFEYHISQWLIPKDDVLETEAAHRKAAIHEHRDVSCRIRCKQHAQRTFISQQGQLLPHLSLQLLFQLVDTPHPSFHLLLLS
mmetsp:Transcript_33450/g.24543  ORF Transcript_33450/g.24543 Transcript_33450/m.24543 type:complete len:101 (-) Transcript_33450:340-642(-)